MRPLGKVAGLWRYPVKSLPGESLTRAELGPLGIPGDREAAYYDENGRPASAKRYPELMLGRVPKSFVLKAAPGDHFDDLPIHLVTSKSLESLRKLRPESDFDVMRFRPNILIELDASNEPFPELSWVGKSLRVGSAVLKIEKGTKRCVMTTHEQPHLPRDLSVLQTVVDAAEARLGVYASVAKPGLVACSDDIGIMIQ